VNQSSTPARLASFAAIRHVRDLRVFLERNQDLLTEEAESGLRSMAFREIDGPHPNQAVRVYLRYRLLAAARAMGVPAAFKRFYGSSDPQVPDDLAAVRHFMDDGFHQSDESDANLVLRICMLAADAALADPAFARAPAAFRAGFLLRAGLVNHQAFLHGAGLVPLNKAIHYWELVRDADDAPRPDQLDATNNLGNALLYLYEEREPHEQAVLERSIALLSEVIGSDGSDQLRASAGVNLASALRTRYQMTGDAADLRQNIAMARQILADPSAVKLSGVVKHNLAVSLADRFRLTGDTADRDEAIDLYQEVLAAATALPERIEALVPLAGLLVGRFERDGVPADFGTALRLITDGRDQLIPGTHDHWDLTRMGAQVHVLRFLRGEERQDLNTAIQLLEATVDLEGLTANDRRANQSLLSELLTWRYQVSEDAVDLVRAMEFGAAARRPNLRRRPAEDSGQ
jgi:hypothetical protein